MFNSLGFFFPKIFSGVEFLAPQPPLLSGEVCPHLPKLRRYLLYFVLTLWKAEYLTHGGDEFHRPSWLATRHWSWAARGTWWNRPLVFRRYYSLRCWDSPRQLCICRAEILRPNFYRARAALGGLAYFGWLSKFLISRQSQSDSATLQQCLLLTSSMCIGLLGCHVQRVYLWYG